MELTKNTIDNGKGCRAVFQVLLIFYMMNWGPKPSNDHRPSVHHLRHLAVPAPRFVILCAQKCCHSARWHPIRAWRLVQCSSSVQSAPHVELTVQQASLRYGGADDLDLSKFTEICRLLLQEFPSIRINPLTPCLWTLYHVS